MHLAPGSLLATSPRPSAHACACPFERPSLCACRRAPGEHRTIALPTVTSVPGVDTRGCHDGPVNLKRTCRARPTAAGGTESWLGRRDPKSPTIEGRSDAERGPVLRPSNGSHGHRTGKGLSWMPLRNRVASRYTGAGNRFARPHASARAPRLPRAGAALIIDTSRG